MDAARRISPNPETDFPSDYALLSDGVPVDRSGQPVACPMDADQVCGYRFHGLLLSAASGDAQLEHIAGRLATDPQAAPAARYRHALQQLRAELHSA